jgi:hypothetical protein
MQGCARFAAGALSVKDFLALPLWWYETAGSSADADPQGAATAPTSSFARRSRSEKLKLFLAYLFRVEREAEVPVPVPERTVRQHHQSPPRSRIGTPATDLGPKTMGPTEQGAATAAPGLAPSTASSATATLPNTSLGVELWGEHDHIPAPEGTVNGLELVMNCAIASSQVQENVCLALAVHADVEGRCDKQAVYAVGAAG